MEQFIPIAVSALGGTLLGPLVARMLGGSSLGGIAAGAIGGGLAHFGADAAGIGPLLGTGVMAYVQSFLEGGIGGGLLGVIAGLVTKNKA